MSGYFFFEPLPGPAPDLFSFRFVEPGEHPDWEEALALVNKDVAATLPEEPPLRLVACPGDAGEPELLYVARSNGEWHHNNLLAEPPGSLPGAVAAVAEAAQESLMELLHRAWPVCPDHRLGTHLCDTPDGTPAWGCSGARGERPVPHVLAPVGALTGPGTSRRGKGA
ncbi:hypothetical protein [Streptomyces sp. NPDC047046]|uniref:hypothetical protein n=1 Tax=Streptomyces sp. NPDC047046 TaxID=3155378 RepID=UPI0033D1D272